MASLESWLNNVFSANRNTCFGSCRAAAPLKNTLLMTIPSSGSQKEIPMFVLDKYLELVTVHGGKEPDLLSVSLECHNHISSYSVFDRIIRDVLSDKFSYHGLVRLQGKDGSNIHTYYGTQAALFQEDLKPLMICTWMMEQRQVKNSRGTRLVNFLVKPIIRVAPSFFLAKQDNVGRFVFKKMIPLLMQRLIYAPSLYNHPNFKHTDTTYIPSIIVESIPFQLKKIDKPSISTTNEKLRRLVLDNLEDMQ